MTVASETSRNDYNGNDVTVEFAVDFYFFINADIKGILHNRVTDVETELTEITHYTLTGAGESAGGTLTMVIAPTSDETLTILRNLTYTQEMDYVEHTNFPADSHERAIDRLTMLQQQLTEAIGRTIKFKETSGEKDVEIDNLVGGKILAVDSMGTKIEMSEGGGTGGFSSPTELTISSDAITVTGSNKWRFHSIDTEGDLASDDLYVVNGGNPGEIVLLQAENDTRTIVCKDFASLKLQSDFSLDNVEDKIMLICISSGVWHEISRASNGG